MWRFDEDYKKILWWLVKWVNEATKEAKNLIDQKTPEDTKRLLSKNKIQEAKVVKDTVQWSVENDTEYAFFVEYWVRSRKYNYNKPKWNIFYRWVGARMFTRTKEEINKNIDKIINKYL